MDPLSPVPLPRDIPLPLPADPVLLQALLVMLFLLHILFVNLMVGGSLICVIAETIGRKRPDFDRLAHEVAKTITVNKSLAVVLGVGPLLAINVLYTVYFYSANALTGSAWMSIVPLVIAAFLTAYAHKYSWERLAHAKGLHLALGWAAALLFMLIPLIFLANINLMLFPERWLQVRGFLSSLLLPNVLPRYAHFVLASVAVTSLFLLVYFTRTGYPVAETFTELDRRKLRRIFYGVALAASLGQLLIGPLVLVTLPRQGMNWFLLAIIAVGVAFACGAMLAMWREIVTPARHPQRRFLAVFVLITATVFAMGYGRHIYRENAISGHRQLLAQRTRQFHWAAAAAKWRQAAGVELVRVSVGEKIFKDTCSACHAIDRTLVGPPVTEIARIYAGNPAGIAQWVDRPGRKRPGMPAMPAFRLGDEKLHAVAKYLLELGSGTPQAAVDEPSGHSG
jgi:cytochrome c